MVVLDLDAATIRARRPGLRFDRRLVGRLAAFRAIAPAGALTTLSGAFFTDNNLVAAGAVMIALPTIIIYFALQKHFVAGLTVGATKG